MFTDLISVADVRRLRDSLKLFDCRFVLGAPGQGRQIYQQAHIPGALHADLELDLAAVPGASGRHPLPDRAALAERFAEWGVNNDDQVVFYDDAGGAFAARGWWLARWCGHSASAVLDGGLLAWPDDLTKAVPNPLRGDFSLRPSLTRWVSADEIASGLDRFTLIDARSQSRFDGVQEPIDPVAGHIPGAHCRPFHENLGLNGMFISPDQLRARFGALTANPVCYCGSGVTAAHNVLAMRLAGLDEPALYPGSWSEWITDPERPVAP